MKAQPTDRGDVTVLLSLKAPDGTTRFVDQLVTYKPEQETVKYFSWTYALFGSYDVFHVHWPEWIVRHHRRPGQWVKYLLTSLFLIRLTISSTPVVRTIHNVRPHRPGRPIERLLLTALDKRTTEYITLNPLTPSEVPATLIRHGHYRERFRQYQRGQTKPGQVLFFGRIEPYKNVLALINAFAQIASPDYTLRIVGSLDRLAFADQGKALLSAIEGTPRVSAKLEFVSDEELVREIGESQLVVLHYTEMHNSGALLVALSLGRVVYSAPSDVNIWIQEEVGSDWLVLNDELSAETLIAAVDHAGTIGADVGGEPNLSNREWSNVAGEHYAVYLRALASSKRRGRP